jgi:hypothetical protein
MTDFLADIYEAESDNRPSCEERPIKCESRSRAECENTSHMFFRIGLDQHLRALCPYHFQRAITYAMEKGRFNSYRCVPPE